MNFKKRRTAPEPGFQLAPMVDIIFLLLSFFVASQIFSQWETSIDIKLPTVSTGEQPERLPGEIIINVLADGSTVVNNQAFDAEGLSSLLTRIVDLFPGQPVLIRADRDARYETVIKILDLCRQAQIWNVAFATLDAAQSTPSS